MPVSTFSMLIIAAPRTFVKGAIFFARHRGCGGKQKKRRGSGSEKTDLFLLLYTRLQKTLSKWTGF